MNVEEVLNAYRDGELNLDEASSAIQSSYFQNLGHTVVDHNRAARNGAAEVVFGEGKTAAQIDDIVRNLWQGGNSVLVTRLDAEKFQAMGTLPVGAKFHEPARVLTVKQPDAQPSPTTTIAVVSAGTSDMAVAEEAALTAEFYGNSVERVYDVGVAGLHRLLARLDDLRQARVLITVAGMEGALPSVVGGLVDKPVIAVPTSVGYGAAFDGVAALLGMLTSCASGLSVVNINNGFGAGYLANMINRL